MYIIHNKYTIQYPARQPHQFIQIAENVTKKIRKQHSAEIAKQKKKKQSMFASQKICNNNGRKLKK